MFSILVIYFSLAASFVFPTVVSFVGTFLELYWIFAVHLTRKVVCDRNLDMVLRLKCSILFMSMMVVNVMLLRALELPGISAVMLIYLVHACRSVPTQKVECSVPSTTKKRPVMRYPSNSFVKAESSDGETI